MLVYGNTRLEAPSVDTNQEETYVEEVVIVPLNTVLSAIAKCESGNRQFNTDGSILRGKVNPKDVGMFQINEKYHLQASIKMGYDIYTEEGNKAYATYLYNTQGSRPWKASAYCHGYY